MGTEQEKIAIDCCKGLGQAAGELPINHWCYTQAEAERIVSNVLVKLETLQESQLIKNYGSIVASSSRSGDPDTIHLQHVGSGVAGDFSRAEFNEAVSQAAEDFFHDNF
jgi:hypothetical protein